MLKSFADWMTFSVLPISQGSLLGEAVRFFIYDTIKIFLLLMVIIFAVSYVRTYLPPEKVRDILSRRKRYVGHILAALLGIVTPFCSCSAVPLFLGFVRAGVPLGVTFTFLVSSPMINEIALVMLLGMFGFKVAALYIGSGFVIAIISGAIIGKLKPEALLMPIVFELKGPEGGFGLDSMSQRERVMFSRLYTQEILKKIWPYILIGVGIGGWIHGYVPTDFLARYASADKWYAVPVATLIGIPLYSNAAGVIPLVSALTGKGVAMGTALAFMMAVTGLSLPEFMILKTVMKIRLIALFAAVVGIGIIFTGYMFNFVLR